MCGLCNNSCCQQLCSLECGFVDLPGQIFVDMPGQIFVDLPDQIFGGDESLVELESLVPQVPNYSDDLVWQDIDEIINSVEVAVEPKPKKPKRSLVRKRQFRQVVPTQLNRGYSLESRKRAKVDDEFAKPKTYECGYCSSDMLSVHVYLRHLKYHREAELRHRKSRCNGCGALFNNVIETRWHQTKCLKRTIVGNL